MCWLKRTPMSTSRATAARTSSRTSGGELVAGQPDVAPGEGQQAGPFALQGGRFIGGRELGDSGGDRGVEREVDEPPLESFLGEVAGCADVGRGVDVGHEGGAADGVGDLAAGCVEGGQGVGVRAGPLGGRHGGDERGRRIERPGRLRLDELGGCRDGIEAHRGDATGVVPSTERRSEQRLADGVDRQAGEPADDRAVDADELQVTADLQLDAPRRVGAVPALDGRGDEVGDLTAVVLDDVGERPLDPVLELRLQLDVGGQALAEPAPGPPGGAAATRCADRRLRPGSPASAPPTATAATPGPQGARAARA